ncbi:unnamed protein product, partial [Prorocentrum cordatum]
MQQTIDVLKKIDDAECAEGDPRILEPKKVQAVAEDEKKPTFQHQVSSACNSVRALEPKLLKSVSYHQRLQVQLAAQFEWAKKHLQSDIRAAVATLFGEAFEKVKAFKGERSQLFQRLQKKLCKAGEDGAAAAAPDGGGGPEAPGRETAHAPAASSGAAASGDPAATA